MDSVIKEIAWCECTDNNNWGRWRKGDRQRKVQKWKDDTRSRNLEGGRSWSSSWLAGVKENFLTMKIQKEKAAKTWDSGT